MITGMHSENTNGSFSSGSATTIALGKQYSVFLDSLSVLTLSLPRVINIKFLLQPHQKYYITLYEELGFSSLTQMQDDKYYQFSLPSLEQFYLQGRENVLFELGSERVRTFFFLHVRYWNTFFTYEAELACEILGAFRPACKSRTNRYSLPFSEEAQPVIDLRRALSCSAEVHRLFH